MQDFDFDSFVATSLIGKRVQIAPHFDRWMRGDKFAEVIGTQGSSGMALLYVLKFDKSGDVTTFADTYLSVI